MLRIATIDEYFAGDLYEYIVSDDGVIISDRLTIRGEIYDWSKIMSDFRIVALSLFEPDDSDKPLVSFKFDELLFYVKGGMDYFGDPGTWYIETQYGTWKHNAVKEVVYGTEDELMLLPRWQETHITRCEEL